ncbi:MAG: hypothetical protein HUJ26_04250 [Planctomycetaceae bacterium]|nr:hypothetical protein [Planctomycetaceae bacterium]
MIARVFWPTVIASVLLSIYLFLFSSIPLGVPGEWEWPRVDWSPADGTNFLLIGLAVCLPASLGWWGFVRWGAHRLESTTGQTPLLLALMVLGGGLLVNVFQILPAQTAFPKSWVLYYPNMSGYYHLARYEIETTEEFLATYEDRMAEGDVLHIGTHPPGLFLVNRGLWNLCRTSPALTQTVNNLMFGTTQDQFDQLEQNQRSAGHAVSDTDRAAVWLSMLLTELISVGTVIPLFWLMCRYVSRETAWLTAAFWPLVPALSVFLPKSDTIFPCLGVLFLSLWVSSEESRSPGRAALAGLVFWCGSMLSLALVPIGLIAGVSSLWRVVRTRFHSTEEMDVPRSEPWKPMMVTAGVSVSVFLALTLLMGFLFDLNLFSVWLWNYRNHAAFYDQFTRTYGTWLWVNLSETFFAVGAPLVIAAVGGVMTSIRSARPTYPLLCGSLIVWGAIWLSGKNSGEAARLWLVFFPIVFLWAARFLENIPGENRERQKFALRLLGFQLVICVVTVLRVKGFFI